MGREGGRRKEDRVKPGYTCMQPRVRRPREHRGNPQPKRLTGSRIIGNDNLGWDHQPLRPCIDHLLSSQVDTLMLLSPGRAFYRPAISLSRSPLTQLAHISRFISSSPVAKKMKSTKVEPPSHHFKLSHTAEDCCDRGSKLIHTGHRHSLGDISLRWSVLGNAEGAVGMALNLVQGVLTATEALAVFMLRMTHEFKDAGQPSSLLKQ